MNLLSCSFCVRSGPKKWSIKPLEVPSLQQQQQQQQGEHHGLRA